MKKILYIFVFTLVFGFSFATAEAAISLNVVNEGNEIKSDKPVDLLFREVNQIVNTNTYRFDFETVAIKNPNIDHWEVRVSYTDPSLKMAFNQTDLAGSGSAIEISGSQAPANFAIFVTKKKIETRPQFTVKLKAFDKNHNRIYFDKEVFIVT